MAKLTPRYLATFGPTVDYRSIVADDLRRTMRQRRGRGDSSTPLPAVFSNVSLLLGFVEGEASTAVPWRSAALNVGTLDHPRLSQTARTYVQNVYWRHRQTIVDVILHQVTSLTSHVFPEAYKKCLLWIRM